MIYMRSWKSLRLTSHTWLGLNPQIGRPLSRIVVPLVYFYYEQKKYSHENILSLYSIRTQITKILIYHIKVLFILINLVLKKLKYYWKKI
jgi:hypothetical protein